MAAGVSYVIQTISPDGTAAFVSGHDDSCKARFATRDLARGGTLPAGTKVVLHRVLSDGSSSIVSTLTVRT